ncbi:MAG: M48 family metalloprotease [Verrucomicrobia bacterium]|jgi:beta-barrel assembly-enhancing protease|nr:M48 family metalloprotease [Verrucomicrobiota bacterium]MBT7068165.1 M48 family metalloprotease [Verrucomicrobiota bacterium]MBT7700421.1 M48 family metalloprotease [Verrucomicrobiota bacterium]
MHRTRHTIGCALLLAALMASAGELQRNTALRSGPGAFFPALELLKAGARVEADAPTGNWVPAQTATTNGWLPRVALTVPRRGIDYSGLLGAGEAVNVSSVDIAAATKGAFASSYSDRHDVDLGVVKQVTAIAVSPSLVAMLTKRLTPAPAGWLRDRLPRRPFDNSIVLSGEAETLLGHAMVAHMAPNGFAQNGRLKNYVNGVGMLVGARTERYDWPYKVGILNDESINGFGMPGGFILISKGYLDLIQNEAELAAVIGHEMAHCSLYHGLREFKKRAIHRRRDAVFAELDDITGDSSTSAIEADLNRLADTSYLKIIGGRAREDEFEADLFGAAYAAAAGYDPRAMVELLQRVGGAAEMDAFRHHPGMGERIAALQKGIARYHLVRDGQTRLAQRFCMMSGRHEAHPAAPAERVTKP